jgi:hypothetical protein
MSSDNKPSTGNDTPINSTLSDAPAGANPNGNPLPVGSAAHKLMEDFKSMSDEAAPIYLYETSKTRSSGDKIPSFGILRTETAPKPVERESPLSVNSLD